jgi:ABC-type phosphate/phosphonate transport system permease subunit
MQRPTQPINVRAAAVVGLVALGAGIGRVSMDGMQGRRKAADQRDTQASHIANSE